MAQIIIDGRSIALPDDIAQDDVRIIEALEPFYPEVRNATIQRSTNAAGELRVTLLKKAGPKGTQIINHQLPDGNGQVVVRASSALAPVTSSSEVTAAAEQRAATPVMPVIPEEYTACGVEEESGRNRPRRLMEALVALPETIHPAMRLAWDLQMLERQGDLSLNELLARHAEIEEALASAEADTAFYRSSCAALRAATPAAAPVVPLGF